MTVAERINVAKAWELYTDVIKELDREIFDLCKERAIMVKARARIIEILGETENEKTKV